MNKKWDRAAMRFSSALYVDRQGMLDATFENGDHFLVAVESILPAASRATLGPSGASRPAVPRPLHRRNGGKCGSARRATFSKCRLATPSWRSRGTASARSPTPNSAPIWPIMRSSAPPDRRTYSGDAA